MTRARDRQRRGQFKISERLMNPTLDPPVSCRGLDPPVWWYEVWIRWFGHTKQVPVCTLEGRFANCALDVLPKPTGLHLKEDIKSFPPRAAVFQGFPQARVVHMFLFAISHASST